MNKITIHQGHVLEKLGELPENSVHCVITSIPYWGLRDYGLEPQVWGGEVECEHEWGDDLLTAKIQVYKPETGRKHKEPELREQTRTCEQRKQGQFCRLCGAWRGSLGLEPTIEMYVEHLVEIFREVKRVLRPTGTFFLNIGDSYSGSGGAHKEFHKNPGISSSFKRTGVPHYGDLKMPERYLPSPGLKPKDLCGIPWRVALALQADGWWLRSDIIWAKPNPMPESCTDRPTRSHEYIFLLTKSAKYFWDQEAVREPLLRPEELNRKTPAVFGGRNKFTGIKDQSRLHSGNEYVNDPGGRNLRSVWTIATSPFPGAHFATFPPELVRRCVAAGTSEKGCCPRCGAPWKRVVEKSGGTIGRSWHNHEDDLVLGQRAEKATTDGTYRRETISWLPTCICKDKKHFPEWGGDGPGQTTEITPEPIPCTVLDPFSGAGTTGLVAAKMGRDVVLTEIKPEYNLMAEKRIKENLGMLVEIHRGMINA